MNLSTLLEKTPHVLLTEEEARAQFKTCARWGNQNFIQYAKLIFPKFHDLCGWNGKTLIYLTTNKV